MFARHIRIARCPASLATAAILGVLSVSTLPQAHADTVGTTTVSAQTSVYANAVGGTYGGAAEVEIPITAGATSVTFSVYETGGPYSVTLNGGGNFLDPDGVGSDTSSYNTGTSGANDNLSPIAAPTAGFLAGVFSDGTDSEIATELNYTPVTGNSSVSSGSYSPTLDQVFFIGDGLTGDGMGSTQTFIVPAGTTELSLGVTDAGGFNGPPGALTDNSGSYTVSYDEASPLVTPPPPNGSPVPEPSSLVLLGTGLLGFAGSVSRRIGLRRS